jgi:hypothetical protein
LTDLKDSGTPIDEEGERPIVEVESETPPPRTETARATTSMSSILAIAALASIGAGAVHATAVGSHNEHRQAMYAFAVLAVFQVAWGALALVRPSRWVSLLGAAGNAAALGGWVLARTSGISFVDGLEESEKVQFADGLAAGLAGVAVLGGLLAAAGVVARFSWGRRPQPVLVGTAVLATLGLVVPGMVNAAGHAHAGGHHDMAGHESAAIPPQPYDGTLPVDFSGVPGVSAEEQQEAEELATRTIERLPQWEDTRTAYEAGFRSIRDAASGVEHYVNWRWIDDDHLLDPDYPESLVYRVDGERRTLVAAMYIARSTDTLETAPEIGGDLIQWHIHDNLCYSGETYAWTVAGIADPPAPCPPGTRRLGGNNGPMIHVWLTAHPCGPFAALEGVGGGQIPEGETRACDHQHGDPSATPEGEGVFAGGGRGPQDS